MSGRPTKASLRAAATALGIALLATACGQASRQAARPPAGNPAAKLSLATSVATTSRNWAVLVVGNSADSTNDFWQLLTRPARPTRPATGGTWRLVTPPGVASNGGLVVAPTGTSSLLAGFLPSQELSFTPLATTASAGSSWSAGVLNARLADTPDALAADPGTAKVLALLADGTLRQSLNSGQTWSTIATRQSVARTQAGRRCDVTRLTGTAFSPSGDPMLTAGCTANGQAGIFTLTSGTWQPSNPGVPARQPVTTLSISSSAGITQVLLAIGDGATTGLVAARYAGDSARWTLSQAFTVGNEKVVSVSTGSNGTIAVLLSGRRGLLLAGAAADWRRLPGLPPGTQALAAGPGTELQALTAGRTTVGVWTLNDSRSGWTQAQHLPVPIQFGSSG
jgi:hypothetical protein